MKWVKELIEKYMKDGAFDAEGFIAEFDKTEFPKNAVPKDVYDKANDAKKDLESQITTANATITDLKKNNKDNEELQKTISTHEETIKTMKAEYDKKVKDMTIDSAIKAKLTDTKYPELLAGKFDRTKLAVNIDGTISGIDEQLTGIRETYKDLFTPAASGRNPERKPQGFGGTNPKRVELEKVANDMTLPFNQRIAAKNELFNLKED